MKPINIIQTVFESIIIFGYVVGMLPFGYWLTFWFVIPLTITNLILAIISKNKTTTYKAVNLIMSFIAIIPLLGFFARITGIIMSSLSIAQMLKKK